MPGDGSRTFIKQQQENDSGSSKLSSSLLYLSQRHLQGSPSRAPQCSAVGLQEQKDGVTGRMPNIYV